MPRCVVYSRKVTNNLLTPLKSCTHAPALMSAHKECARSFRARGFMDIQLQANLMLGWGLTG